MFPCHLIFFLLLTSTGKFVLSSTTSVRVSLAGHDSQHFEESDSVRKYPNALNLGISSELFSGIFTINKYTNAFPQYIPVRVIRDDASSDRLYSTQNTAYYRGEGQGCELLLVARQEKALQLNITVECRTIAYMISVDRHHSELDWIKSYDDTDSDGEFEPKVMQMVYSPKTPVKAFRQRRSVTKLDSANVKYIEIYVIVDKYLFSTFGNSVNATVNFLSDLFTGVDSLYRRIHIRTSLVGVEIWDNVDQIAISTSASVTLGNLKTYAEKIVNADNIQLLTSTRFDDQVLGLGYVGGMCSLKHSSAVSSYVSHKPLSHVTTTLSHEMGHNLNMSHDVSGACPCSDPGGNCVMSPRNVMPSPRRWSQCSVDAVNEFVARGAAICLNNLPGVGVGVGGTGGIGGMGKDTVESECGNGVVEAGEECDCGDPSYCTSTCCDANTCKLKQSATCWDGPCCNTDTCQPLANDVICRKKSDTECDVDDTCDGISTTCRNKFEENGMTCDEGRGACFDGSCRSRQKQCQQIWGESAVDAHAQCYKIFNDDGKYYGHCNHDNSGGSFTPCYGDDRFCGVLQCDQVANTDPVFGSFSWKRVATIRFSGVLHKCVETELKAARQKILPGMVYDWTPCAADSYCISGKCTKTEIPKTSNELPEIKNEIMKINCQGDNCKEDAKSLTNADNNDNPISATGPPNTEPTTESTKKPSTESSRTSVDSPNSSSSTIVANLLYLLMFVGASWFMSP